MESKRYRGETVDEALGRVRSDLGDSALIIETRKLGAREVEVVAAPGAGAPAASGSSRPTSVAEMERCADVVDTSLRLAFADQDPQLRRWIGAGLPAEALMRMLSEAARERGRGCPVASFFDGLPAPRLGSRVQAFVGPHGVGKSTIVAKLAVAASEGRHRGQLALVGAGFQRATDVEGLRRLAGLVGCPHELAFSGEDLERFLDRHPDCTRVLVDTPGIAAWDDKSISQLADLLNGVIGARHLVLPATGRARDLQATLQSFEPLGFDHLAVTGLDRARQPAGFLACLLERELPLSYLTDDHDAASRPETGLGKTRIGKIGQTAHSGTGIVSLPGVMG